MSLRLRLPRLFLPRLFLGRLWGGGVVPEAEIFRAEWTLAITRRAEFEGDGLMEIHQYDVNTALVITIVDEDGEAVNVASATVMKILLRKPDDEEMVKTAVLDTDGSDGKIKYLTIDGDLDQHGTWEIQGFVKIGSSENYTAWESFRVIRNTATIP